MLENGLDLYVNERQKIQHYHARSKKKNATSRLFYFAQHVRELRYYSDVIHSFNWKSAVKHDGGV